MIPTTMNRTRRLMALAAAATLVLATGACSSGGSDQKADTTSAAAANATSDASTKATTTTAKPGTSGQDETPTTAAKDDGPPIGSSTGQLRANPNDSTSVPLRLDVRSIERVEGDTIEVRFTITNTSTDDAPDFEPYSILTDDSVDNGANDDVGSLALLDRPNDKKYLTLFDTNSVCLCTGVSDLSIAPGETAVFYADVTGPPKSVETVDLSLAGFQPVNGLDIS